jgi:pimeloyl-ACP methyl ester carboxylesterase
MNKHYFHHQLVDLHYYIYGSGPQVMLCFHGYGMHGRQFACFEELFGKEYTLYSFDLFFHEGTKLQDDSLTHLEKGMEKSQLIGIIKDFCKSHSIQQFSILSYSIGTACAGVLIESNQFRIETVVFMAPAFLKIPKSLTYLGQPGWRNRRFRQFLYSEYAILFGLRLAKAFGYFNAESYPIIKKELGNFQLRHMFYATVTFLRKLKPDIAQLISALNHHKINVIMVYGKYDHHFPAHIGKQFEAKVNNVINLIVDRGHDMVDVELSKQIRKLI